MVFSHSLTGIDRTRAVYHRHELRTLATLSIPDTTTLFLALAKVLAMKHSSVSIWPCLRRSSARERRIVDSVPSSTHRWQRRWQVWYDGSRLGKSFQRAPERKIHRMQLITSQSSQRGRPRPSEGGATFGNKSSIKAHCSSCNSSRRGIVRSRWLTRGYRVSYQPYWVIFRPLLVNA